MLVISDVTVYADVLSWMSSFNIVYERDLSIDGDNKHCFNFGHIIPNGHFLLTWHFTKWAL